MEVLFKIKKNQKISTNTEHLWECSFCPYLLCYSCTVWQTLSKQMQRPLRLDVWMSGISDRISWEWPNSFSTNTSECSAWLSRIRLKCFWKQCFGYRNLPNFIVAGTYVACQNAIFELVILPIQSHNKIPTSVITMNIVSCKDWKKSLRVQNCLAVLVTEGDKLHDCLKIRKYRGCCHKHDSHCRFFRLEPTTPSSLHRKLQMAGRGDDRNPKLFLKISFLFTVKRSFLLQH